MTDKKREILPDIDPEIAEELQDEWMRLTYAAEYLGIFPKTLYRRIEKGTLDGKKGGPRLMLVRRSQILDWDFTPLKSTGRPPKKEKSENGSA